MRSAPLDCPPSPADRRNRHSKETHMAFPANPPRPRPQPKRRVRQWDPRNRRWNWVWQ
ncbi:hypothetical protein GCM10023147_05330 [Tsukamurella soli]|uniref:Uncharacterized protein n=1 Tax=Tsukamurella soli TaxID=644556 RepID=A0ABP8J466_9ACTN